MKIKIELNTEYDLLEIQNAFKDSQEASPKIDTSILDNYIFGLQECANDYEGIKAMVYNCRVLAVEETERVIQKTLKKRKGMKVKYKKNHQSIKIEDIEKLTISFVYDGSELNTVYKIYYNNGNHHKATQSIEMR